MEGLGERICVFASKALQRGSKEPRELKNKLYAVQWLIDWQVTPVWQLDSRQLGFTVKQPLRHENIASEGVHKF